MAGDTVTLDDTLTAIERTRQRWAAWQLDLKPTEADGVWTGQCPTHRREATVTVEEGIGFDDPVTIGPCPAGCLPDEIAHLLDLAGYAEPPEQWRKIRARINQRRYGTPDGAAGQYLRVVAALTAQGLAGRRSDTSGANGDGRYQCPLCGAAGDGHGLRVTIGDTQPVVLRCFACQAPTTEIIAALGLTWDDIARPLPVTVLDVVTMSPREPNGSAVTSETPDHRGLATVSLADAHGDPPEPLTNKGLPVWSGLLHALVGAGESCKSLIAASAVVNLIRGGHPVLILDGEMSARAWRARFLELGLNADDLHHVHYAEITAQAVDVDAVRATVTALGIRLIVWDSALSVISRTARSENDNAEVARVYDRLRDICRDGPAGLIVDHVAAAAGTMISRGATAKFNAVDFAYGVKLTDGSVPNFDDPWTALITVEKDRHGMSEKRRDREATFVPLGDRRLEIDIAELDRASHRLTTIGRVDLVQRIAALAPPAASGNDAYRRIGGNRTAVLAAFKWYRQENS
jgi:hypothetical protein